MAKKNNLYVVYVYTFDPDTRERITDVVYESTKREKADSYLHDYLKNHENEIDGAYIECKPMARFNKREAYEDM